MHTDTNLPEPAGKPPLDQRRRLRQHYVASIIFVDFCRDLRVSAMDEILECPLMAVTSRCSSTMRAAAPAEER
jgi:hypothetical protein